MLKKIKNIILDSLIWIMNAVGTPFMKMVDKLAEREDEVKEMKKLKAKKAALISTFTTTTTIPHARLTISNTGNPGIRTTTSTSTSTINPYNFQAQTISPSPFSISFSSQGKTKTVTLENNEDIFKLADVVAMLMKINNIPFKITES